MIEYHNPLGESEVEVTPYTLSTDIRGGNQVSVAFLANGFPDSVTFLKELEAVLQEQEPGINVFSYKKKDPSIPANAELLNDIRGKCQAVIAAYGH